MAKQTTSIAPEDLERIRAISEALFGAKHRLPMAVVIASAPTRDLYAHALAAPAGTSEAQAGTELKRFADAGLLELLADESWADRRGRPPKRYAKRRSSIWALARKLAEEEDRSTPRRKRHDGRRPSSTS